MAPVPGTSPLADLQAAYASVCAAIRDYYADPKPNYSVDGVTLDRMAYYRFLAEQQEMLRKIPGVAPDTNPTFDVWG